MPAPGTNEVYELDVDALRRWYKYFQTAKAPDITRFQNISITTRFLIDNGYLDGEFDGDGAIVRGLTELGREAIETDDVRKTL